MDHYSEAAAAAKRLESVEVVRYKAGKDPWLVLRVDGRLVAVPKTVNTTWLLINFVCKYRSIQMLTLDNAKRKEA